MLLALLLLACSNLAPVDTGETGGAIDDTGPEIIECCSYECESNGGGAHIEGQVTLQMCEDAAEANCVDGYSLSEC